MRVFPREIDVFWKPILSEGMHYSTWMIWSQSHMQCTLGVHDESVDGIPFVIWMICVGHSNILSWLFGALVYHAKNAFSVGTTFPFLLFPQPKAPNLSDFFCFLIKKVIYSYTLVNSVLLNMGIFQRSLCWFSRGACSGYVGDYTIV